MTPLYRSMIVIATYSAARLRTRQASGSKRTAHLSSHTVNLVQHFGLILNYLRDGECDLPTDPRERKDLLREAEHYEVILLLTHAPSSAYSLEASHLLPP